MVVVSNAESSGFLLILVRCFMVRLSKFSPIPLINPLAPLIVPRNALISQTGKAQAKAPAFILIHNLIESDDDGVIVLF